MAAACLGLVSDDEVPSPPRSWKVGSTAVCRGRAPKTCWERWLERPTGLDVCSSVQFKLRFWGIHHSSSSIQSAVWGSVLEVFGFDKEEKRSLGDLSSDSARVFTQIDCCCTMQAGVNLFTIHSGDHTEIQDSLVEHSLLRGSEHHLGVVSRIARSGSRSGERGRGPIHVVLMPSSCAG